MKLIKLFKALISLSLLMPIIALVTSCQNQNDQITNINSEVGKILGLYDIKTGNSLIKQVVYTTYGDDGWPIAKSNLGISTNYNDALFLNQYNLFGNIDFNNLLKPENIINPLVIKFIISNLKVKNYHNTNFSDFKFEFISYQPIFNKKKSDFWVEPTIATIAIIKSNNDKDNIISKFLVNVAGGEIPITKKSTFNLRSQDLVYTSDFSNSKIPLTAKKFNSSVKWNKNPSIDAQNDQIIANMLGVKVNFKISSSESDSSGIINDQEFLKSDVRYYIALFIGDKYIWSNYVINYR